jgi:hypothetical protein
MLSHGTTVSCVSEELAGKPLRISGRIVPEGTKTAQVQSTGYHCALIEEGKLIDVDESLEQTIENLKAGDVAVIGANAIDVFGNSALMYGIALGGGPGRIISGAIAEIENIIIAAGLEKLVPGSITDIVTKAGRKNVDRSIGMAVGLVPLAGRIITEKDAISLLGEVNCTVVGRGGLFGAEGATTMIIEGDKREVEKIFEIILSVKDQKVSGTQKSLPSCTAPHERCKIHRACIYKKTKK